MEKKRMSNDQKYRKSTARGPGPGAEGRAKIKAAEKLAKKSEKELAERDVGEGTIYGLRSEGSRKLGQDYARKIGGKGEAGYYAAGGKLKMVEKGGKKVPAFAADGVGKMAMGGKCRGMGSASKGGNYSKAG